MRRFFSAPVAAIAIVMFSGCASAVPQPHMESALAALEQARHEIEIADQARDHGGHAAAATGLIEQAIREVHEGIRYRDEHGR
jgi:hypothetical protein